MTKEYERIAFVAISKDGEYKVDYVSYTTGEPILVTARGTKLAPLVEGIEKNKKHYIGE